MDLDPAAVMAEHQNESTASWTQAGYARFYCWGCQVDSKEVCLPYRLAEALAASEAKVARVERLAEQWEQFGVRVGMSDVGQGIRAVLAEAQ